MQSVTILPQRRNNHGRYAMKINETFNLICRCVATLLLLVVSTYSVLATENSVTTLAPSKTTHVDNGAVNMRTIRSTLPVAISIVTDQAVQSHVAGASDRKEKVCFDLRDITSGLSFPNVGVRVKTPRAVRKKGNTARAAVITNEAIDAVQPACRNEQSPSVSSCCVSNPPAKADGSFAPMTVQIDF